MIRLALARAVAAIVSVAAALMLLPCAASAEDRRVGTGSFSRLRVEGAFEVTVTTGGSPGAVISADHAVLDVVDLHIDGSTMTVRRNTSRVWSHDSQGLATAPIRIALSTNQLAAASVMGGGKLTITRMAAPRVDLAMAGPGAIAVAAVQADQLVAQLIGGGAITLAGRTASARLTANGTGSIDAAALDAGDLVAHLDGLGAIKASARFEAQVSNSGLGSVDVATRARCRVTAPAGGPVRCGI